MPIPDFAIADVLPSRLNALVKNIMKQAPTDDANEAVRLVNSGERVVVEPVRLNPAWISVSDTMVAVNLAASPSFLVKGVDREQQIGQGGVLLERRQDGLHLSDNRVVLVQTESLTCELRSEATGGSIVNANVLEALYHNPALILESWKKDPRLNIFFPFMWWIFRDSGYPGDHSENWPDADIVVTEATHERFEQEEGRGGPTYIYGWDEKQDVPVLHHGPHEGWKCSLGGNMHTAATIITGKRQDLSVQYVVEVKIPRSGPGGKITIHLPPDEGWGDFLRVYNRY